MSRHAHRFEPLPPHRAASWDTFLSWERTYFPSLVGVELVELRTDYARVRLPFRPELEQPAGVVHGGAVATLIDTVVVPAIGTGYDERRSFATVTMSVEYRAAVVAEDLVAEGWVEHRGRSMVFCRAEVTTPREQVVAAGSLVYKVSSRRPEEPKPAG
jgi:uncharacterized protein (TIGR00369 family)